MTNLNTAALREMMAKATPGPWDREGNDIAAHGAANDPRCDYYICEDVNGTRVVGATHGRPQDNAELIVAAVNALPTLLDNTDRLAALEAGMRDAEAKMRAWGDKEAGPAYAGRYYNCADELSALLNRPADGGE